MHLPFSSSHYAADLSCHRDDDLSFSFSFSGKEVEVLFADCMLCLFFFGSIFIPSKKTYIPPALF